MCSGLAGFARRRPPVQDGWRRTMTKEERTRRMLVVSRRLLNFAALSLAATSVVFAVTLFVQERLMISWLVFECGIIGGFVSIQQRLRKIEDDELQLLSESWATILLVPIYGGIFALVLYTLFLGELVQGHLFPRFAVPEFHDPPTTNDLFLFLTQTYPQQGSEVAKLIFWSFVAGFSERFVPQIIARVADRSGEE